jgi:hypothetical protein
MRKDYCSSLIYHRAATRLKFRMITSGESSQKTISDYPKGIELPPDNSPPLLPHAVRAAIMESTRHMPRPRIWETLNQVKDDHANHQ